MSQTAASNPLGISTVHQTESPPQRRKRFFDQEACSGQNSPSSDIANLPSVITSANTIQRPCDFYTPSQALLTKCKADERDRPPVPLRKSLLKNKVPCSEDKFTTSLAESMVASAMDPIMDSGRTDKHPNFSTASTETSRMQRNSLPPPGRSLTSSSGEGDCKQPSEIVKRVFRRRLDLESWRRRSEPVASAIKQAVNLHGNNQGESSTSHQSEDGIRHSRSLSLREEIRRSKEKMDLLDKSRVSRGSDSTKLSADSQVVPSLSSFSLTSSLPPPAASTGLKYCGSPMLKNRVGGIPSPRPIRSLSRKSRSFSNIDMTEMKQSFRDRLSWKGELPILKKTPDYSESGSTMASDLNGLENTQNAPFKTDSLQSEPASKVVTMPKSEENHQAHNTKRASRENQAKPLSLS